MDEPEPIQQVIAQIRERLITATWNEHVDRALVYIAVDVFPLLDRVEADLTAVLAENEQLRALKRAVSVALAGRGWEPLITAMAALDTTGEEPA